MRRLILSLCILLTVPWSVGAVEPEEMLDDPVLEARAREISRGLRCVVCQNQSIDDSDAQIARDLRVLVRERLRAGDSNEQVIAYITARYGDFVLLRPPVKLGTVLLWFGPPLLLVLGVLVIWLRARRRAGAAPPEAEKPLSADERKRLAEMLKDQ